jgi:hypothetical protein
MNAPPENLWPLSIHLVKLQRLQKKKKSFPVPLATSQGPHSSRNAHIFQTTVTTRNHIKSLYNANIPNRTRQSKTPQNNRSGGQVYGSENAQALVTAQQSKIRSLD